jgi:hypothetical protein
MFKFTVFLISLITIFFYSCTSHKAFDVEDEMMGGEKYLLESPIGVSWISLETTSSRAKKKSEDLIPLYYSLFYIPENNEVHITSIAEHITSEVNINKASSPTKVVLSSEFKTVNIYKLFFKDKRTPEIEDFIAKNSKKIKTLSFNFKVTEDPEVMMYKKISEKIKKDLLDKLTRKYLDENYEVNANFLVLKVYDFRYKNIEKKIEFKTDYIFTKLKKKKPNLASNLDSIEELISTNMETGNYKNAQKFNEMYKNIAPDKAKYYNNALNISEKLNDKMSMVLILIEQIQTTEDLELEKANVKKIKEIYKGVLSKRDHYKLRKALNKEYKKYLKEKLPKEKFVEYLKNLLIEYSLD